MADKIKKRRKIRLFTNLQIFIAASLFALWIAFFSEDVNVYKYQTLRSELDSLTHVADSIRLQTYRDSVRLQLLKSDDSYLEKYARETFYMHKEGEEVFVVE